MPNLKITKLFYAGYFALNVWENQRSFWYAYWLYNMNTSRWKGQEYNGLL